MQSKTVPENGMAKLTKAGKNRLQTWQSVQGHILRRIRSGEWPAGQLIPTEQELALSLGCARATVNRALTQLALDGIVEPRRRVGTRVAKGVAGAAIDAIEFRTVREEVEAAGAKYDYCFVSSESVAVPSRIADVMHVAPETIMLRYRAAIMADGQPYCIEIGYVMQDAMNGQKPGVAEQIEPVEWLRGNVPGLCGRLEYLATALTAECASDLGAAKGVPVMTVDRTIWSNGNPLTHTRRVYAPGHKLSFAR